MLVGMCLHPASQSDLSLRRLLPSPSPPLCFSSVCTVCPDATARLRATSHCLGAVNHVKAAAEDSCALRKLLGYGGSFHKNTVSLGGEPSLRPPY